MGGLVSQRNDARRIVLVTLVALAIVMLGCGDDEDSAPGQSTSPTANALEGQLVLEPVVAAPGDEIQMIVENTGETAFQFTDLVDRVERQMDGEWRDATADVLGVDGGSSNLVVYEVAPGETSRVDAHSFFLPGRLDPGTYRAVKTIRPLADEARPPGEVSAEFRVEDG
jgi:hypothetical protein